MIKREGKNYVLYSRDGSRKLFTSPSYQACINKEAEIKRIVAAIKADKEKKK